MLSRRVDTDRRESDSAGQHRDYQGFMISSPRRVCAW